VGRLLIGRSSKGDSLEEEIKKKTEKKYHNKIAEAIQNMQFGPILASLTKLFIKK